MHCFTHKMIDAMLVTVRCDTEKCYASENEDLNDPPHETTCMDQGGAAECDLVPSGTAVGNSSFVHVFYLSMCWCQLITSGAATQVSFMHCKLCTQFETGPICMNCYLRLQIVQAILLQWIIQTLSMRLKIIGYNT